MFPFTPVCINLFCLVVNIYPEKNTLLSLAAFIWWVKPLTCISTIVTCVLLLFTYMCEHRNLLVYVFFIIQNPVKITQCYWQGYWNREPIFISFCPVIIVSSSEWTFFNLISRTYGQLRISVLILSKINCSVTKTHPGPHSGSDFPRVEVDLILYLFCNDNSSWEHFSKVLKQCWFLESF